jgi:hypothetical protein
MAYSDHTRSARTPLSARGGGRLATKPCRRRGEPRLESPSRGYFTSRTIGGGGGDARTLNDGVLESSRHGAVTDVARQLGIGPESVRQWVRQAEIDRGDRGGLDDR